LNVMGMTGQIMYRFVSTTHGFRKHVSSSSVDRPASPLDPCSLCRQEKTAKIRAESDGWKDKHKQMRSKFGISPTHRPWTAPSSGVRPELKGVPHNARFTDCLDLAWASRKVRLRSLPFYCDYTQCPTRTPWGPVLRTFTTSSRTYDFQRDRVVSPTEGLALHGFPIYKYDWTMFKSESSFYTALGESMSCPCVGSVLLAVYLNRHAPWWQRGGASIGGSKS
jgi:site-specific DNA-cytosine methylase